MRAVAFRSGWKLGMIALTVSGMTAACGSKPDFRRSRADSSVSAGASSESPVVAAELADASGPKPEAFVVEQRLAVVEVPVAPSVPAIAVEVPVAIEVPVLSGAGAIASEVPVAPSVPAIAVEAPGSIEVAALSGSEQAAVADGLKEVDPRSVRVVCTKGARKQRLSCGLRIAGREIRGLNGSLRNLRSPAQVRFVKELLEQVAEKQKKEEHDEKKPRSSKSK